MSGSQGVRSEMKLQKQSEMQDFFDALGIDENIFEQMAETFTSNFMIEGKTTTDLNEMLSRARNLCWM